MYNNFSKHLENLKNLPVKIMKMSLESWVVKQIAVYLGNFLNIMSVQMDSNILLILAFMIVAVVAYYILQFIINMVYSMFSKNKKDNNSMCSSSSYSKSKSCSSKYSSKCIEIPSMSSCSTFDCSCCSC